MQPRGAQTEGRLGERFYRSALWAKLSAAILRLHPWCECEATRCGRPSELVHHIEEHGGDGRLFFARANLLPVSRSCHQRVHQARRRAFDVVR